MNYHSRAQEVEWITSLDIELKLLSVKGTLGLQVIVSRSNVSMPARIFIVKTVQPSSATFSSHCLSLFLFLVSCAWEERRTATPGALLN